MVDRCRDCKQEVRWGTTTRNERPIMLELEPTPELGEWRLTYEEARMKNGEVFPAVWWADWVSADHRRRATDLHQRHSEVCDPITAEDVATADTPLEGVQA